MTRPKDDTLEAVEVYLNFRPNDWGARRLLAHRLEAAGKVCETEFQRFLARVEKCPLQAEMIWPPNVEDEVCRVGKQTTAEYLVTWRWFSGQTGVLTVGKNGGVPCLGRLCERLPFNCSYPGLATRREAEDELYRLWLENPELTEKDVLAL